MSASPAPQSAEITRLLLAWGDGDPAAAERLMPLVYDELKRMAHAYVRQGRGDRTLQRTALVHEAFLRLIDQRVSWQNRSQFYGLAGQMMRRIAIDDARRRARTKRGSDVAKIPLDLAGEVAGSESLAPVDAILLDRALAELAAFDPDAARVVELKFFAGLTIEEIADVTGASPSGVKREWAAARAWLYRRIAEAHV